MLDLLGDGRLLTLPCRWVLMLRAKQPTRERNSPRDCSIRPSCPLLNRLTSASNTLLNSLLSIAALVPAAVVFQNTGAEAPPANYLQPLLRHGLVFYCRPLDYEGQSRAALHLVVTRPTCARRWEH